MLFTEPLFFLFFTVVFVIHWILRRNAQRKVFLLGASYVFYAAWDWRFLGLIVASTLIDYCTGMALGRVSAPRARKRWLTASILTNLGILGVFKYYNFFVTSARTLANAFGFEAGDAVLEIVLPVGISFYTFQSMSYSIDIYRGKLTPVRNFLDFALFVGFFPQLVAGPIVRAAGFLPQLSLRREFNALRFKGPLTLFLVGFFKKSCIAENVAPYVDQVFANPEQYTALSIWIATVLYAVQIYCDFSGYSDMAIATARLLGYELCVNFSFPYLAVNIRDFWRRWHVSLSTWLQDYLYISLGGGRRHWVIIGRNVLITMLLGGLWHGASWNFVVWGGLHGVAVIAHRVYARLSPFRNLTGPFSSFLGWLLTMYWVCLAWIFFRADDFWAAMQLLQGYVFFRSSGEISLAPQVLWLVVPAALVHLAAFKWRIVQRIGEIPDGLFSIGYGCGIFVTLLFASMDYKPFIYFQF